jgi:hypothetical protein
VRLTRFAQPKFLPPSPLRVVARLLINVTQGDPKPLKETPLSAERLKAGAEDAADLLNHIAGALEGLRKIAAAGQLDHVVQAIDIAFGEIVAIARTREGEAPVPSNGDREAQANQPIIAQSVMNTFSRWKSE